MGKTYKFNKDHNELSFGKKRRSNVRKNFKNRFSSQQALLRLKDKKVEQYKEY